MADQRHAMPGANLTRPTISMHAVSVGGFRFGCESHMGKSRWAYEACHFQIIMSYEQLSTHEIAGVVMEWNAG